MLPSEAQEVAEELIRRLEIQYGQVVLKVKNQQVVAVDVNRSYHPHPRPGQS